MLKEKIDIHIVIMIVIHANTVNSILNTIHTLILAKTNVLSIYRGRASQTSLLVHMEIFVRALMNVLFKHINNDISFYIKYIFIKSNYQNHFF